MWNGIEINDRVAPSVEGSNIDSLRCFWKTDWNEWTFPG